MENISERIAAYRQKHGLSQPQMGDLLGVTGKYVSMLERGVKEVSEKSSLVRLLKVMEEKDVEQIHAPSTYDEPATYGARFSLKQAREAKGLSVKELAGKVGYSVSTYQDIEEGHAQMGEKMAHKVASALGLDVSILMNGADEPPSRSIPFGTFGAVPDIGRGPGMEKANIRYIPLLSWAQCGKMGTAFDDTAYTKEGFIAFDAEDRKAFAVNLYGDSMSPIYGPGDVAIVYPSEQPTSGDLVIARLTEEEGGDVMFKIYQGSADRVVLTSYNPAYAPMQFTRKQFMWIYPVDAVNKKVRRRA